MSRMRVSGTEHVNSPLNDGSHGWIVRMISRDDSPTVGPCLYSSPATHSMLMKMSLPTSAMRFGRWWCPSSVHCSTPVPIQRAYVDAAATFSLFISFPCPTSDCVSSSFWIHDVAAVSPAAIVLNALSVSGMFTPPSLRCDASCIRRFSSSWSRCRMNRRSNSPRHSRVAGGGDVDWWWWSWW